MKYRSAVAAALILILSCIAVQPRQVEADEIISSGPETLAKTPPQTPVVTIKAEFVEHTRYAVFQPAERPVLWIEVAGARIVADGLVWTVTDFKGETRAEGTIDIAVGNAPVRQRLVLGDYGAGYFEVWLGLKRSEIKLPAMGSRPEGFVSYAVLPKIQPLTIASADLGRFGGQGTNFVESGKWMQGDYLYPVYPLTGMKWVYMNRRLHEIASKGPDSFHPILDPEVHAGKNTPEKRCGMCILIDMSGIPDWLMARPDGIAASPNNQAYPPKDYEAYGKLVGQVAAEQAARRKGLLPQMAKNYYEIHWEPDWHWKGTDDDFIRMYEVAYKAIHENDPDAMLLGANYGVLATGNRHLERLFAKGLGKFLDGIVTHVYYIPLNQTPEEGGLVQEMRHLRAMVKQYLPEGAPIIMSEWGVSDLRRIGKRKETSWFMRGHLLTLGEGARTTFFFYTADMKESGGLFYNLTTPNPVFGATHISPKLLFSTCAAATRLLEGTTNLGALDYLDDNVLGYAFDRGGIPIQVLWATDGKEKSIMMPFSGTEAIGYDAVGNPLRLRAENGTLRVSVNDLPVYILGGGNETIAQEIDAAITVRPGEELLSSIEGLPQKAKLQCWKNGRGYALENGSRCPRAIQPGVCALQVLSADGKTVSASHRLEILPAVTMTLSVDNKDELVLHNALSEEIKGTLKIMCGSKELLSQELSLAANAQASITLDTKKFSLSSTAASMLSAVWTDSFGVTQTLLLPPARPVMQPHLATTAPVIDGNLSDWDLELFETIDSAAAVKIGRNDWQGASDLSFRMAIRYDAVNLYLAFKVRDNVPFFQRNREPWESDSIQIGLDSTPDEETHPGMQKLCFAWDPESGALRLWRHAGKDKPQGELAMNESDTIRFAVLREGDETRMEIAIRWGEIGQDWQTYPAGGAIGIGVFVNDNDPDGKLPGKRKAMEAFGGMGWTKAEEFGKLLFPEE